MELSEHGVEFIAHFENIYESRYCPYWDQYGRVYTRGFGETDWSGNFGGRCITHQEALDNLKRLFKNNYASAINNLHVPLTQNQFDALASFVWNLGPGSMEWDVGRNLRARNYKQAALDMLPYDISNGVYLSGLAARRQAEYRLFMTPDGPSISTVNPLNVLYPNERKTVDTYLAYHKHPHLHSHGIKVMKEHMMEYRDNIWDAAEYGKLKSGKKVKKGWDINNRRARYHIMRQYTS